MNKIMITFSILCFSMLGKAESHIAICRIGDEVVGVKFEPKAKNSNYFNLPNCGGSNTKEDIIKDVCKHIKDVCKNCDTAIINEPGCDNDKIRSEETHKEDFYHRFPRAKIFG